MSHSNVNQAKFTLDTTGGSTPQQTGLFASRPGFASCGSYTSPTQFAFGESAASKQAESIINVNNRGLFGPASSNIFTTLADPDTKMLNTDDRDAGERYYCTACKSWASNPCLGFCCDSCSNFYHCCCTNGTGEPRMIQLVGVFGLNVCRNCHFQLRDSKPAPFPNTRPLCHMPVDETDNDDDKIDERTLPRRSNRDAEEISRCKTPDQVAITVEHFTAEAKIPFFKSFEELTSNELDEPMIEALFDVNDPVFPRGHPDRSTPFKITACYFNSKEYPEDQGDGDGDLDDTKSTTVRAESTINEVDDHNNPDIFGKHGWFYKLERSPLSDSVAVAEVILWHEDSLELALEDDSDDDMDLDLELGEKIEVEVNVKKEAVTEEIVFKKTVAKQKVISQGQSAAERKRSIVDRLVAETFGSGLEIFDEDDDNVPEFPAWLL